LFVLIHQSHCDDPGALALGLQVEQSVGLDFRQNLCVPVQVTVALHRLMRVLLPQLDVCLLDFGWNESRRQRFVVELIHIVA
jgi:hypothetical protein